MNKPLRLLLLCAALFATVTSSWAQTGKEVIAVGQTARDVATGAGAASHIPQVAATTTAITREVTQVTAAAQRARQINNISSHGDISAVTLSQRAGVGDSASSASLRAPHIPSPSTVSKEKLPTATTLQNTTLASITLAQHLITPYTQPDIAKAIDQISDYLEKARLRTDLTALQHARLEEAERYFFGLTPEQANQLDTLFSAPFRQHALFLRAPAATEYGYFFTGSNMTPNMEHLFMNIWRSRENMGYIPTIVGNPKEGFSPRLMQEAIQQAPKTDQPIFVLMDMHGDIDDNIRFSALAEDSRKQSTEMIVKDLQELRQATGTPELNLYLSSCHSGAFLDEFETLPLTLQQGINVFVSTGAGQYAFTDDITPFFSHEKGADIAQELTSNMIELISYGRILAQANIAGQPFNPLELAIQKANTLPDKDLLYQLTDLFNLQKTKQRHTAFNLPQSDVEQEVWYFVARVAYDEAAARYGSTFDKNNRLKNVFRKFKKVYARFYPIPTDWDLKFGFKPL